MRTKLPLVMAIAVSACANHQTIQPIDFSKISSVQADIKRQIGVYLLAKAKLPSTISKNQDDYWCGNGSIDFDISSVKADLTTSLDNTSGGSLGVTVPIAGGAGSVGPSVGLSNESKGTQELIFNEWPLPNQTSLLQSAPPPTKNDLDSAPIAEAILALRAALIQAALRTDPSSGKARPAQACFTTFDPAKPGDAGPHSFTLGVTTTEDANGGLELKLAVLDAKLTADSKAAAGNSLTVTFTETGAGGRVTLLNACTKNPDLLPSCHSILAGDWSGQNGGGVGLEGIK